MRALIAIAPLVLAAMPATAEPERGVLARVPAESVGFAGIDLVAARKSPALASAVTALVRAAGLSDHADRIAAASALVIARAPGAREPRLVAIAAPGGSLAFGAVWLDPAAKRRLAMLLPDLGEVEWIAGTLELSAAGVTVAGSAAFADPYVAARLAVSIGMGRKVVASQLPAPVAVAFDKIAFTAMGATIRITATWSTADLEALLAILGGVR